MASESAEQALKGIMPPSQSSKVVVVCSSDDKVKSQDNMGVLLIPVSTFQNTRFKGRIRDGFPAKLIKLNFKVLYFPETLRRVPSMGSCVLDLGKTEVF